MTTREEEMAKLKTRYAQARGTVVEQPSEKKEPVKKVGVTPRTGVKLPRFNITPYTHIIKNDVRRLFGLKSLEELEKEARYDPLLESWKRSRNMK